MSATPAGIDAGSMWLVEVAVTVASECVRDCNDERKGEPGDAPHAGAASRSSRCPWRSRGDSGSRCPVAQAGRTGFLARGSLTFALLASSIRSGTGSGQLQSHLCTSAAFSSRLCEGQPRTLSATARARSLFGGHDCFRLVALAATSLWRLL